MAQLYIYFLIILFRATTQIAQRNITIERARRAKLPNVDPLRTSSERRSPSIWNEEEDSNLNEGRGLLVNHARMKELLPPTHQHMVI